MNQNQMSEVISLSQEWHIGKQIGSGGFGSVYLARSGDGVQVVAKFIPKVPGADRELLFEELEGVPNVVPILDRGEWGEYWVLVMPKAEKSLRKYLSENIEHLTIDDTVQVLIDITEALVAIEGRIVHRDLKPDNVLFLDGCWCLADFGISKYAESTTAPDTHKYTMTYPYAAPEQWRAERATSATDVYAMGIVAYELLAGQRPFTGPEVHDYRKQHLENIPEAIPNIPIKVQSLIAECLYKIPEARPSPQNLLTRLRESIWPNSDAVQRLQQANALAVDQLADEARQLSVAKSALDRRLELCKIADQSLENVVGLLRNQIEANAPTIKSTAKQSRRSWSLNKATLSVEQIRAMDLPADTNPYNPPFEVVAYSSITVSIPPDQRRYEGRSHSLWYCDAQERGIFRWYETAFMFFPGIGKIGSLDPFKLDPGQDAYLALSPMVHTLQVAWPFTPIDQGDEGKFIEYWIGWFADAAQGQLHHPSNMPERDPTGSWRQGE